MRIDMPFDKKVFCQGLQRKGTESRIVRGITYYKICTYKDLDELLGHSWHYRGINLADDFCYVVQDTVEYHLNRRKPLIQYVQDENGKPVLSKAPQGHALIFSFVRGEHIFFFIGRTLTSTSCKYRGSKVKSGHMYLMFEFALAGKSQLLPDTREYVFVDHCYG